MQANRLRHRLLADQAVGRKPWRHHRCRYPHSRRRKIRYSTAES
jgi:hypothetical protein